MKTAMKLVCALLPVAALNCGGEPLDTTAASDPGSSSDQAELVKVMSVRRNADGTVTRTESNVTRQQYDTLAAARSERIRLKKAGQRVGDVAAAPILDVEPGDCWQEDSSWLYPLPSLGGSLCCVVGSGAEERVSDLCGFTYLRSIWQSNAHTGWFFNNANQCYTEIMPGDMMSDTSCFPTWYGQF